MLGKPLRFNIIFPTAYWAFLLPGDTRLCLVIVLDASRSETWVTPPPSARSGVA